MGLSVCCITGVPASRLAAVLAPWRGVADELVVGCDDRSPADVVEAYEGLADRVVPIRFRHLEAHLEELHRACTGDWILRVDADEVPAAELLEGLPGLLADPGVGQWAMRRRWLAPDLGGWLDEQPWAPDWQVRLVRNDEELRFSGDLHTGPEPTGRLAYTLAPLYHLDCALQPVAERRDKAILYDVQRPGLVAPGGKPMVAYYEPERWASRPPVPLPAEDRPAVAALLAAAGAGVPATVAAAPAAPAPPASATAPDARITVIDHDLRYAPGEHRPLTIEVANTSGTAWPGGEADPPIRLTYRWGAPGEQGAEGFRTLLPRRTEPGEATIVPLLVGAPEAPGRADLVVDLVHENVRWFGVECPITLDVVAPPAPPERRERRPSHRRWPRTSPSPIPKVLHRVWLGDRPLPEQHRAWGETWRRHHPGWELRLWTDADVPSTGAAARARNVVERSDVVRYELLRRHGGVYVDTDVECLRPIEPLMLGVHAFAGYEVPGRLCNAVLGVVPGHPAIEHLTRLVERTSGVGHFPSSTGPLLVTRVLESFDDVTLYGPERFYPFLWDEVGKPRGEYPDAYAVHHWAMSWKDPAEAA